MTADQKELVKATVPILKERGLEITTHFYSRMFTHNPELKNVFNMGNQQKGNQQTALAMAVLAYGENIDDPSVLMPVVNSVSQKHTSLDIRPEHYDIVGKHLLASIKEVLGDAATDEIIDAWEAAYIQLTDIFTNHESQIYRRTISKKGGWTGWRPFIVKEKTKESREITSFYLYPSDEGPIADFLPGQYISVKVFLPELKLYQPRQYSISSAPNGEYYRISVKRESPRDNTPEGMVSNFLHDHVKTGSVVQVAAPAGDFTIPFDKANPVVFISGGIGQTPLLSMLEASIQNKTDREIIWIHGSRNREVHAFHENIERWAENYKKLRKHIFYDVVDENININDTVYSGIVDLKKLTPLIDVTEADYYICGPAPFIKKQYKDLVDLGVPKDSIHYEEFGPQILTID